MDGERLDFISAARTHEFSVVAATPCMHTMAVISMGSTGGQRVAPVTFPQRGQDPRANVYENRGQDD